MHYRRGTLVESRPCWQVVPLPSPAVPSTRSDEHLRPSVTLPLFQFLVFPYTPILPSGSNNPQCWWAGMYSGANQDPQSISLINKTSVYPNLVVSPHSGEKPMNRPRPFPLSLPPGRQTNLKCPPFSAYYFMTHSLTTHFLFCV